MIADEFPKRPERDGLPEVHQAPWMSGSGKELYEKIGNDADVKQWDTGGAILPGHHDETAEARREHALSEAIRACPVQDADVIVDAAKKFEAYLKG